MADTIRTIAYLLSNEFQPGQPDGSINSQDMRDLIVTFQSFIQTVATNSQSAAYTIALSDMGIVVEYTGSAAANFTIPADATLLFPTGTVIEFFQYGTGQIALTPAAGVALRTPGSLTTRVQYSTIGIRKRSANEWVVSGDFT